LKIALLVGVKSLKLMLERLEWARFCAAYSLGQIGVCGVLQELLPHPEDAVVTLVDVASLQQKLA
jgi:hypothetical protein